MIDRRTFLKTAAAGFSFAATTACGPPGTSTPCEPCSGGQGLPGGDYFAQLRDALNASGFGTPQIVIDLDRLDANADAIVKGAGADRYRIVEKSLPSLDLLEYLVARTGSSRFLVLHLPFVPMLLQRFAAAHVLVGKAQPTAAVKQVLASIAPADVSRVTFLADSAVRLGELKDLGAPLRVAVEIDVGLHRGGVRRPEVLPEVLGGFAGSQLTFAGFVGYDGHVTAAPGAPGVEAAAARKAFGVSQQTYAQFVEVLNDGFPELVRDDLVFHSGGTTTFPLYEPGGLINDVAAGGGMLRPAGYGGPFIGALSPALFLAAPVLTPTGKLEIPYATSLAEGLSDAKQGFTLYGGGWAANVVWPQGIAPAPFTGDGENVNLIPNASWMTAPEGLTLGPGDWVFHQPKQGDALFQFEDILLVRDGRLVDRRWQSFPRRY
ncbi:MAG: alanine racemase [Myxococcaceae bacterium]|nr:alanine racemase [Myxococcaceae bacterium]